MTVLVIGLAANVNSVTVASAALSVIGRIRP